MSRLSHKAIIVTGAAAGIGLGIAAACRHQGAAVVMVDKDPAVEDAARDIGAIPLVADVTAPDSA
ncbi:MAG: SDR family NAD(P)-dependent oxidoreductase, partial [Porticoccaceae bacterium]